MPCDSRVANSLLFLSYNCTDVPLSHIHLSAYRLAVVPVKAKCLRRTVLIEEGDSLDDCLQIDVLLVTADQDGSSALMVSNHVKSAYHLRSGGDSKCL